MTQRSPSACASGWLHGGRPKQLTQRPCIGDGVALGIVVEVHVHVTRVHGAGGEALCPLFELSTGEADAVRAMMEADVAKRPDLRDVGWGRQRPSNRSDQRTAAIFQDACNLRTVPGG